MFENFKRVLGIEKPKTDKGIEKDFQIFHEITPRIENLFNLISEAEGVDSVEELNSRYSVIEEEYEKIKSILEKTYHGGKYFQEDESEHKDSLEMAGNIALYVGTPFENFRTLTLKINYLKTKIDNLSADSLHD